MKYHFTTNSRIIPKIFANYPNTFLAFCELINNSLQAEASQIRIGIEQISDSLNPAAVRQITIKDNGVGVSQSEFKKKILEIGTDVKRGGKGIGRFAAFQIGSFLEIETVAYDNKSDKYVKSVFQLDGNKLESNRLETVNLEINHEEFDSETDTYYQVTINRIYDEQITCTEKQKKLHKNLLKENLEEAIFMQYPLQVLNDETAFFINEVKLDKNRYLIGKIETRPEIYNDPAGESHELTLSFINYKSRSRKMRAFLRVENNNIRTIGYTFDYNCDIPDPNGWLIYIDSKLFDNNSDIFRNISISDLDIDSKHLLNSLKTFIDGFFKDKFKEYIDFAKKLKNDVFYPYKGKEVSSDSKSIAFNQLAYFIENEHRILSEQNKIRRIVYPLIDKAINHGELIPIITQIIDLKNDNILKFHHLLEKTELEDVIRFSEDVAKKVQLLNFLEEIIYGKPSKYIKERSQLHKIVEKNIWIFGEQYNDTPILFSDKSLKNNLTELRTKWFDYDLTQEDDNLIELKDTQIKDITDLFFFNEKIMDNQKREVMVVELKSPKCRISQKELNQLDRYQYDIEKIGKFSKEIYYKIFLVCSEFTDYAETKIGGIDQNNPYLYNKSKINNIETYVIRWSDLIHSNRRKLTYLGYALQTKDRSVREVFEKDYPDIATSDLYSKLSIIKE